MGRVSKVKKAEITIKGLRPITEKRKPPKTSEPMSPKLEKDIRRAKMVPPAYCGETFAAKLRRVKKITDSTIPKGILEPSAIHFAASA